MPLSPKTIESEKNELIIPKESAEKQNIFIHSFDIFAMEKSSAVPRREHMLDICTVDRQKAKTIVEVMIPNLNDRFIIAKRVIIPTATP